MVKSKIIFSILFAIVFSVITIFAFIPLNNSQVNSKFYVTNDLRTDTINEYTSYSGTQIVIPYVERWRDFQSVNTSQPNSSIMFALNFYYDGNQPYISFYPNDNKCGVPYGNGNSSYWLWGKLFFLVHNDTIPYIVFDPINKRFVTLGQQYSSTINSGDFIDLAFSSLDNRNYFLQNVTLSYNTNVDPSFNFISIEIGSTAWNGTSCSEYIQYNASNGYFFRLDFYSFDIFASHFENRIYYTQSAITNADFNLGYNEGVSQSYDIGYNDGVISGYDSGYDQGFSQGEVVGYVQGIEAGSSYTFMSLISATIDAPIQAFLGLFDFQVFGVDMKHFILGLILLSIVFIIIRLVIKGGR